MYIIYVTGKVRGHALLPSSLARLPAGLYTKITRESRCTRKHEIIRAGSRNHETAFDGVYEISNFGDL